MDIRLSINGIETKIGIELAGTIVDWLPDNENNKDIFHELAQHISSTVRKAVANKNNILKETAKLLLKDKDVTVLENILGSDSVKDIFDTNDFKYILGTGNDEILETLIYYLDEYRSMDIEVCYKEIMELNNDYLNLKIANKGCIPKEILQKLLANDDPDIINAVSC